MEDTEIVDLFLARDETALGITSEKYGKRLRSVAYKICGDMTAAEECENDTYLKAWDSIPPHTPRTYLFSFLAKITRCTAIDRVKTAARKTRGFCLTELTSELENSIPCPNDTESRLDGKLLSEAISGFLRTLTAEKRNIFLRRYWYMDPISEISKRYSISEGKIKSVLFRTRNELHKYLKEEGFI